MDADTIPQNRLYGDLAYLWPLVSPTEDYKEEARDWIEAIRDILGDGRHTLLELGVGGGSLLSHLTSEFDATAVDLSEEMLRVAAEINPDVTFHTGDMRTIRLGATFDAVIVHDAIDYMTTEADLLAVFKTAAAHLDPGGVFLTMPGFFRETFREPSIYTSVKSNETTELTFVQYDHLPDTGDTIVESIMTYFIKSGAQLTVEYDRHITGIFPRQTWSDLFAEAGFRVQEHPCKYIDEPGFVLFTGIRC